MAESPPWVVVSTTGVKTDFADPEPRSVKPPLPPGVPRVVEVDEEPGQEEPRDRARD